MKNILLAIATVSVMTAACAGAQPHKASAAAQFKLFAMDNKYFSCLIPADWELNRDQDKDAQSKIYEIQLLAPDAAKAAISIYVSYYAKDNEDFNDYKDFIKRNSTNSLGETKSKRESYSPVKKISINGRKGFELTNEMLQYLNPESKSDASVAIKENIFVLPAKEGFFVLHYSAPKADYNRFYRTFTKVARSFKGLP